MELLSNYCMLRGNYVRFAIKWRKKLTLVWTFGLDI